MLLNFFKKSGKDVLPMVLTLKALEVFFWLKKWSYENKSYLNFFFDISIISRDISV